MAWLTKIKNWILAPYYNWQDRKWIEKRRKEMQEKDPFIYK